MKKHIVNYFLAIFFACMLVGCAKPQDEVMYPLASRLLKLTESAEALERFAHPDPALSDEVFLAEAVEHDPQLINPFDDYTLKVLRNGIDVILLVCTKDGQTALLEDFGCTTKLDCHHWKQPNMPCEFSMEIEAACSN